jgi:hypothetical protein
MIFQDVFGDVIPDSGPKHYLNAAGQEITPAHEEEVLFQYRPGKRFSWGLKTCHRLGG